MLTSYVSGCLIVMSKTYSNVDLVMTATLLMRVLNLFDHIHHIVHVLGDFEEVLISVQKCFKILEIPKEKMEFKLEVDKSWPQKGEICFKNVELKYRPNTDMILKNLSFSIKSGEKIGVVGRTGAGKSTLTLALTRILELSGGSIEIDG